MKKIMFLLIMLFSFSFISASYVTHQQDVDYNFSITSNFATNCTLKNINSPRGIIDINQTSTGDGSFNFNVFGENYSSIGTYCHNIVCTDGTTTTSGDECIDVNLSGVQKNTTLIIADIFLILIICVIILILHNNYKNKSYKDSNSSIAESHNGNWGKTFIKTMGENLMRNSFLWYYSLGWIILIILKDLVYNFNTQEIYTWFVFILNIYSFGLFLVIVTWIGFLMNHFKIVTDMIDDLNLGVEK